MDGLMLLDNAAKTANAANAAQGQEPVREDRVAEIKEQIANGTYNIPMSAVAEKMAEKLFA